MPPVAIASFRANCKILTHAPEADRLAGRSTPESQNSNTFGRCTPPHRESHRSNAQASSHHTYTGRHQMYANWIRKYRAHSEVWHFHVANIRANYKYAQGLAMFWILNISLGFSCKLLSCAPLTAFTGSLEPIAQPHDGFRWVGSRWGFRWPKIRNKLFPIRRFDTTQSSDKRSEISGWNPKEFLCCCTATRYGFQDFQKEWNQYWDIRIKNCLTGLTV